VKSPYDKWEFLVEPFSKGVWSKELWTISYLLWFICHSPSAWLWARFPLC